MALSRFVVTGRVTVPAGTFTLDATSGLRLGTGSWAGPAGPPQQWAAGEAVTFLPGQVVWADSSGGSSAACQLYAAIGSGNLRAYADGQDAVGHAAISN